MGQEVVAREGEIRTVGAFLGKARPGVLLIEGEPGIGKTTVWRYGCARAAQLGYRVLSCRPIHTETPLAFAALADLLEPVLDATLFDLPPPQARALQIALIRAEANGERRDIHAVSAAVLGIVRRLAARGPVLIAVDDLQWLDRPTARVLEFVIRRVAAEPVGMLATVRVGEQPFDVQRMVPDRLTRLAIGPLSTRATQRILRAEFGTALSRSVLERIHRASGGNPFYALEIGRAIPRGSIEPTDTEPLPVPAILAEVARTRLRKLSARARRLLLVVALLAQPTLGVLDQATGDPEEARDDLHRAARAGVVELTADRIRFTHPLLGAAATAEATPGQRRRLHRHLAGIVGSPEERVRHLALATVGPDEEVAAELERVAEVAYLRGAVDTAIELSTLSLKLTPLDASARNRRRIQAAEYLFAGSDLASARQLLDEAIAAEPPGVGRADILVRLAKVRRYLDRRDTLSEVLAPALAEAGDDVGLRAVIHQYRAEALWAVGDLPGAVAPLTTAVELAKQAGDGSLVSQTAAALALVSFVLGQGVRPELVAQVGPPGLPTPHVDMPLRPNVLIASVLKWADDTEGARLRYEAEYRDAISRGAETDLPHLLSAMGELEYRAGNWDLATRYVAEGMEAATTSGSSTAMIYISLPRGLLATSRGQVEEARAIAAESLRLGEAESVVQSRLWSIESLGLLELSLGNPMAAIEVIEPLLAFATDLGPVDPSQVRFLPDAVEAYLMLGNLDEAEKLLLPFEDASWRLGRLWGLATAGRCRGLLLASRGDLAGGIRALEGALRVHECLPMPLELGRTELAMGEVWRRAKHKRAAKEHLERASGIFEGLGAPLWGARATAALDRVGPRPAASVGLTPTEGRVADLAARGRTNREIAAELFVSHRTVEDNLTRIYRKIGVRSRAELARRFSSVDGSRPSASSLEDHR